MPRGYGRTCVKLGKTRVSLGREESPGLSSGRKRFYGKDGFEKKWWTCKSLGPSQGPVNRPM